VLSLYAILSGKLVGCTAAIADLLDGGNVAENWLQSLQKTLAENPDLF